MPFLPVRRGSYSARSSSTPTRRNRVLVILFGTSLFVLATLYIQSDNIDIKVPSIPSFSITRLPKQVIPAKGDFDFDPKIALDLLEHQEDVYERPEPYLWDYASDIDNPGQDVDSGWSAWGWVGTMRRPGYRRPSWGGLSRQGPRAHIRDNLKEGMKYLTTFPAAGFNNQVMEHCNLISIALRSDRIPILAAFAPHYGHLQHHESFISVSEIFDLSELVAHYETPIIDMLELKVGAPTWENLDYDRYKTVIYDGEFPQTSTSKEGGGGRGRGKVLRVGDKIQAEPAESDDLFCWNGHLTVPGEGRGHTPNALEPLSIRDVPLPISAYANLPFSELNIGRLSLPRTADVISAFSDPTDTLPLSTIARLSELDMPPSDMAPDDPIGCVTELYYAHLHPETEDIQDDWRNGVGAWAEVGKYLKFQPGLERLARDLVGELMGIGAGKDIPPYMAVHIRRTDFVGSWRTASQRQYAYQARLVLDEMKKEHGVDVKHLVFTTDEEDEEWLAVLKNMGWIHIDHRRARTGERLGWWFPTILDSVILSSAKVFLGVPHSTMSILPYRRVQEWHGGISRFFRDPDGVPIPDEWAWATDPTE